MTTVARDLSIVYGSLTLTPANGYFVHEVELIDSDADTITVEFDVIVRATADTDASFATAVTTFEDGMATADGDFTITQNGETLYSLLHSANTGMNARPTFRVRRDPAQSGRVRVYSVRIAFDRPATFYSNSGRRNSRVRVLYSTSRHRTLILTGEWTATGGNSARTQYEAQIDSYITTVTSAFTGSWDKNSEEFDTDEDDKIGVYRVELLEIKFNQSQGTLDNTAITRQEMQVRVSTERPGDSLQQEYSTLEGTPVRFLRLDVNYRASIDFGEETDLDGFWASTILPHIMAHALDVAGADRGALILSAPDFDAPENIIQATLSILAVDPSGGNLIEYTYTEQETTEEGVVFDPVWTRDAETFYGYQGPRVASLAVEERARVLASGDGGGGAHVPGGGGQGGNNQGGGGNGLGSRKNLGARPNDPGVLHGQTSYSTTPLRMGFGEYILDVIDHVRVRNYHLGNILGVENLPQGPESP
jgi:hypothetical protein